MNSEKQMEFAPINRRFGAHFMCIELQRFQN